MSLSDSAFGEEEEGVESVDITKYERIEGLLENEEDAGGVARRDVLADLSDDD